jgi:hypothetical protein
MFEKCGLAQEAQKVAQNLAAAAAAGTFGGATPFPGKRGHEAHHLTGLLLSFLWDSIIAAVTKHTQGHERLNAVGVVISNLGPSNKSPKRPNSAYLRL